MVCVRGTAHAQRYRFAGRNTLNSFNMLWSVGFLFVFQNSINDVGFCFAGISQERLMFRELSEIVCITLFCTEASHNIKIVFELSLIVF